MEDRYTIIAKAIDKNGNVFIFNRNSDEYLKLYEDNKIKWLEIESGDIMTINDCNIEVLETLPLDNYYLKDQKEINKHKASYIKLYKAGEDEQLCNILFSEYLQSIRIKYHNIFEEILGYVSSADSDTIINILKNIWFDERYKKIISMKRIDIYEKYWQKSNDCQKTILSIIMILKPYWFQKCGNYLPLSKTQYKQSWKTIRYILEEYSFRIEYKGLAGDILGFRRNVISKKRIDEIVNTIINNSCS